jgi:hypothetical protein
MANNQNFGDMISSLTGVVNKLNSAINNMSSGLKNLGNQSQTMSNTFGGAPSMGNYQSSAPTPPRFSSYYERTQFGKILGGVFGATAGLASATAMALPTTQEAVDVQALAERMRFYGGGIGYSAPGKMGGAYQTTNQAMRAQLQASVMGTATSPEDAALATNAAAQRGLLPGLQNFGAGKGYSGIMGGAALASNLSPGLGLAGGVGVMSSLNSPQLINMSRMFGIQIRNAKGTGMMDLPNIINQLYDILSKATPVITKENIAISAMPGNALDSILNQYFGMDPNVRSVIIAGLIQRASGDKGFGKDALTKTGGLTAGISSTGNRAASELNLLQQYSGSTVRSLIGANNVLQSLYGGLVNAGGDNSKGNSVISGVQKFSTNLETLAGARGGAGQILIDSIIGASGAGLSGLSGFGPIGKMIGATGLGAGAYFGYKELQKLGLNTSKPNSPFAKGSGMNGETFSPTQVGVTPSTAGPIYTGAITINVSGGTDQYNTASAITDALTRAM